MENNDYITRRNAMNAACSDCYCCETIDEFEDTTCPVKQKFMSIPAADVEPKRKTGRWVYKHRTQVYYHTETGEDVMTGENRTVMVYTDLSGKYPHCPYCDALAADSFMDYCPHCGAKMLPEPPKGKENAD